VKISVTDGAKNDQIDVVQFTAPPWIERKPQCWHMIHTEPGRPQPFDKVFLKRWIGSKAPAHELLTNIHKNPLPGVPRVFGHEKGGKDYFYAFQFLPSPYKTIHEFLTDKWEAVLTPAMGKLIIEQAAEILDTLVRANYVFTDFSIENMFFDPAAGKLILIDIDSAWPLATLMGRGGRPENNQFNTSFWWLWIYYMRQQHGKKTNAGDLLAKSMILSFAAVWSRVLGLLNNPQHPANKNVRLRLRAFETAVLQEPFWKALSEKNKGEFEEFLQFNGQKAGLYEKWQEIFQELIDGDHVHWKQIIEVSTELLSLYPDPVIVKKVKKKDKIGVFKRFAEYQRQQWNTTYDELKYRITVALSWIKIDLKKKHSTTPADDSIDWAIIRRNLYDPLRIFKLTRRFFS
jgi:hypothetical protein